MCDITRRIDEITSEDLHLAIVAGIDDIPCDDLTYDDQNPGCVRFSDGLMI